MGIYSKYGKHEEGSKFLLLCKFSVLCRGERAGMVAVKSAKRRLSKCAELHTCMRTLVVGRFSRRARSSGLLLLSSLHFSIAQHRSPAIQSVCQFLGREHLVHVRVRRWSREMSVEQRRQRICLFDSVRQRWVGETSEITFL